MKSKPLSATCAKREQLRSEIVAQALIAGRTLKKSDPWKSIRGVQSANRGVAEAQVELAVARAVREARKDRRR
jgi:hypothetical protein